MKDLGPASIDDVILAWLLAEKDSKGRFDQIVESWAHGLGFSVDQILDPENNVARMVLLALSRGYGLNRVLFVGFPTDVTWRRCILTNEELAGVHYASGTELEDISGPGLLVSSAAAYLLSAIQQKRIDTDQNPKRKENLQRMAILLQRVIAGDNFEDLVAVSDCVGSRTVLIEGHTRATAYVAAEKPAEIRILLGTSARIGNWARFQPPSPAAPAPPMPAPTGTPPQAIVTPNS